MALLQKHRSALSYASTSRHDVVCVLHTCSADTHMQVIMYDEPTAGLDPVASTVVEDLMRSMHDSPDMYSNGSAPSARSGITSYIVVTHQHSTIRRAVDRLIFLHEVRPPPFLTPLCTPGNPVHYTSLSCKPPAAVHDAESSALGSQLAIGEGPRLCPCHAYECISQILSSSRLRGSCINCLP